MSTSAFPVVGIGASAGGIDAFHSFFDRMPADCGMAFVVILHLPAHRNSMLTDILARWTPLRVVEAEEGTEIQPNCVYVPPPHVIVSLIDGILHVEAPVQDKAGLFRPIDRFFDSLAVDLGDRAVGIVLSGTGSDGALGLKAIKECGGLTFAQGSDGTVPQYEQMPAGAIATGAVDLVISAEDMPRHLLRVMGDHAESGVADDQGKTELARLQICAILRSQLGHDFSDYRSQTFLRRVERRMQMIDIDTLPDYLERLTTDREEVTLLFRDLLIRVTSFFRDKETFDTLAAEVIPQLFLGKSADSTVRVWVPGCATGEEAYSLAILLRERMDALQDVPRVQIFATDIDDSAITTARLGRYPSTLLKGLSDARRERFFRLSQGSYVVTKEIRDLCTFSPHNLVRDPPFSRMDLVSCRNLLIYMNPSLQAKVIPIFHYSLVKDGILLLGASESVARHSNLFRTRDKVARIFQRQDAQTPDLLLTLVRPPPHLRDPSSESRPGSTLQPDGVPPAVQSTDSVTNQPRTGLNRRRRGDYGDAFAESNEELLNPPPATEQEEKLQASLRVSAEQLRSLEEQHQTALEELRSSNEEMHSVNEEMQSTNEELETSKEELQSLNEELHTVNLRLSEKNDELDRKNTDLRNLFESTEIATVFLNRHLIIRGFTPAIGALYNLIPTDIGRSLIDIKSRLSYSGLENDVAHVLSTLGPIERRVRRIDESAHYIMRILPYREPDSTVSGVLVTFVDVSSIVKAETALLEADVAKDVFLATLSHELRNPLAPIRSAARLLQSPSLTSTQLVQAQAIIARQVHHMSSLLDDLLDVSRITRGAFMLKKEYVDIQVLLDGAVEAVQPLLDAKEHTFRLERPPTPIMLEVDPVRITQVINNLLTNAAKYTPPRGLISAGARLDSIGLLIFVRDNGLGIEPDKQSKVFDMFTQIDSDVKRTEGGLGIGLSLSKGLVQLHGGRLDVHSEGTGKGSEFTVTLPRSVIVETPIQMLDESDRSLVAQPRRRILLADDNVDGAQTMSMLLELDGHEVHLAHTGTTALEAVKRLKPDIAILDIGMPDIDGYQVAQHIRHEAWGENILLIAITGWGQAEDKRRAIAAGFDHHMTKPVDPEALEGLFK